MGRQGDVVVSIEPASGRSDESSDAWLDQVAALRGELRARLGVGAVAPLAVEPTPAVTKGAWQAIGLSIASAATLTALVEVARAWLGREPGRSLTITWVAGDGRRGTIELRDDRGDPDVTAARFEALRAAVAERPAGTTGPTDGERPGT